MLKKLAALVLILFVSSTHAAVKLPAIFGGNMVLQQKKPIPVWGWADPNEMVTVSINGQKKQATANGDGKWMLKLDPIDAGGPYELTVAASNTIELKNVLVGEVWVCSGQSNMEMALNGARTGPKDAAEYSNPNIRLFNLQKQIANERPAADCKGNWAECNAQSSPGFSAVAWYFGRELQKTLNVPVGLIHTSWGGTPIEFWLSKPEMASNEKMNVALENWGKQLAAYDAAMAKYEQAAEKAKAEGKPAPKPPQKPSMGPACLYNGMIAPILPYAINGTIWYQGESNAGNAALYQIQMPAMIKQWRKDFDCGEWPFLMVQLANFMERKNQPVEEGWAALREAQLLTAQSTPKTGQAVIIDIGDAKDIHPRNKDDVGKRLALLALRIEYKKDIVSSGPEFTSMNVEDGKARLKFKHVGGGLMIGGGGEALKGFAIAGADGKFEFALAIIEGDSVLVWSDKVKEPKAVRYGWANNPDCNLYNKDGLPATPFRTDH